MTKNRIEREKETVRLMITTYCQQYHGAQSPHPCQECRELVNYAFLRLERCPFQEGKTTCGKCSIHCYQPKMRQKIKEIMRTIGPAMIWHQPWAALRHFLDGFRRQPRRR